MVALGAGADRRLGAVATIEALRKTECRLAVLARVARIATADAIVRAVAVLSAFQTAFWIGSLSFFSLYRALYIPYIYIIVVFKFVYAKEEREEERERENCVCCVWVNSLRLKVIQRVDNKKQISSEMYGGNGRNRCYIVYIYIVLYIKYSVQRVEYAYCISYVW